MLLRFEVAGGETAADEPPNGIGESLNRKRNRKKGRKRFT